MAKVKTFAVTVEWTERRTVYVEARRPGGAEAKALTHEGWAEATAYSGPTCDEGHPVYDPLPKGARVVEVRPT